MTWKGPDDAADSGAYRHDQLVLVKVQPQVPATQGDVGCQGGEQPHLPRAQFLHLAFAVPAAQDVPQVVPRAAWGLVPDAVHCCELSEGN